MITSAFDGQTHVLLGNGDGTFQASQDFNSVGPGLVIADLNGDGKLDVIETQYASGTVGYALGNGDGSFQDQQVFTSGEAPVAVAAADYNGDGVPDLIVANSGVNQPTQFGPPTVVLLPGQRDNQGQFAGFGSPQVLATGVSPQDLQVADLNGDGIPDVVVVDRDGLFVIFGKLPTIKPNDSQDTARGLGTAVHLVQPTLSITPSNQDAWYRLQVPTEVVSGAKDEVLDFSGGFASQEGAGLGMEVVDPTGNVRGSGERFRVVAHQGETLYVHIFGKNDLSGVAGAGAYTLDIDTLPQVAAVEAQNLLPGQGTLPGGPTTSLVLVFQGDRLDADLAMDSNNYTVTWAGPDGLFGTQDDRQIAVGDGLPPDSQTVVYDPSSNLDVASGLTYPTAIRQTVTLLFGTPLPAGNYQITVSANVVSADFSLDEQNLLSSRDGFTSHPVVSVSHASVQEGAPLTEQNLVQPSSALGNLDVFEGGTRFLTQFHNDLGALLDVQLTASGSGSTATQQLLNQILARFGPALGPAGQRLVSLLVIFLDPVSIGLVDPERRSFSYDLQTSAVASNLPRTFVQVGGNVEAIVIADPTGSYQLNIADAAAHSRGGFVFFGDQAPEIGSLTEEIRGGAARDGKSTFTLDFDPPLPMVTSVRFDAIESSATLMGPAASKDFNFADTAVASTTSTSAAPNSTGSDRLTARSIDRTLSAVGGAGSVSQTWLDSLEELWQPPSVSTRLLQRLQIDEMISADELLDFVPLPPVWRAMKVLLDGARKSARKEKPPAKAVHSSTSVHSRNAIETPPKQSGHGSAPAANRNSPQAVQHWLQALDLLSASNPLAVAVSPTDRSRANLPLKKASPAAPGCQSQTTDAVAALGHSSEHEIGTREN